MTDRHVYRVLDVNFNRSREALRVLEDVCRFRVADREAAWTCKELRRSLAEAARPVQRHLVSSRNINHDIGQDFDRAGKTTRSVSAMVQANVRRLQEALRSIEEHGRVVDPKLSNAAYRLRFQAYRLEQAILPRLDRRTRLDSARLYVLVSSHLTTHSLDRVVRDAVRGGADIIQLREEGVTDRQIVQRARRVREITLGKALFIMNDRVDVALAVEADGVHLGKTDLPLREARRVLGEEKIIGATTHSIAEARRAVRDGADYISVGPVFSSATKPHLRPAGLEYVRRAVKEVAIPFFAIGGIDAPAVANLRRLGCSRIAVCAAVIQGQDVRRAARKLRLALDRPLR